MRRRPLARSVLLVVLGACGDGPTDVESPAEATTAAQSQASAQTLTTVILLLDDPFVWDLMDGAAADPASLYGAVRDASTSSTTTGVLALSRELTRTRSGLLARVAVDEDDADEEDADAEIHRAVLDWILEDAATLLEQPVRTADDEENELARSTPQTRGAGR